MIVSLNRFNTNISLIQEIPAFFFTNLEASQSFGYHLFPTWTPTVFGATSLMGKFESVYNKYKAIKRKSSRDKVLDAFTYNNQIEHLCNNQNGTFVIELTDLPKSIQKEIDTLFLYLYDTAINYHGFETFVSDNVKESIDRFIRVNGLEVCPLCGLEGFLNLDGQARIALDHWLCKDLFPMSAVNFDNLFPIGHDCNARPAKGSKNILYDATSTKNRVQAFYPYLNHGGVSTVFSFVNEPTINGIRDVDWILSIEPRNNAEQNIFINWDTTLNISLRYYDYYRKNIFPMWEEDYKTFIEDDHNLKHAVDIAELRENFRIWRASFQIKKRSGAILYRPFIDYLINQASDPYLFGLCENFKR